MTRFSQRLQSLLSGRHPITLGGLIGHFGKSSFAILCLLLMAIPALPLPTSGITHIFEVVVMLLSLELIAGRKTIWLPRRWLAKRLPASHQSSALPKFTALIRWIEKYARPRWDGLLANETTTRLIGVVILIFTVFAFLAPPFSGLDTLPSLGVVIVSLALIFEDALLYDCWRDCGGSRYRVRGGIRQTDISVSLTEICHVANAWRVWYRTN